MRSAGSNSSRRQSVAHAQIGRDAYGRLVGPRARADGELAEPLKRRRLDVERRDGGGRRRMVLQVAQKRIQRRLGPSRWISTPLSAFSTQPVKACARARRNTIGRNPTPWTPRTRTRRAVIPLVGPVLASRIGAGCAVRIWNTGCRTLSGDGAHEAAASLPADLDTRPSSTSTGTARWPVSAISRASASASTSTSYSTNVRRFHSSAHAHRG